MNMMSTSRPRISMDNSLQVGDRMRDNKRAGRRPLIIERFRLGSDGQIVHVGAREGVGCRLVWISIRRVHSDATRRSTGFTLLPRVELPHEIRVLIGKEVGIRRGSRFRAFGPGCERIVRARLDKVECECVHATLLDDDPLATLGPMKAGESGVWHGLTFVAPMDR